MTLLITGASGQLGRAAADWVLDRVPSDQLVFATRMPGRLAEYAERGVEVREADFGRPGTLAPAFVGVSRMLLISTDALGQRTAQHAAAVDAAVAAGVQFIAYTSFPQYDPESLSFVEAEHAATEQRIRESGLDWCILRNFPYAEEELRALTGAAVEGALITNTGSAGTAYVSRADCAAAAGAVLTGDGHAGRVYDITGPEAIGADRRGAIFAELSGRPITVRNVDDATLAAHLATTQGLPSEVALQIVGAVGEATRGGLFAHPSDAVLRLTGVEPTGLAAALAVALAVA